MRRVGFKRAMAQYGRTARLILDRATVCASIALFAGALMLAISKVGTVGDIGADRDDAVMTSCPRASETRGVVFLPPLITNFFLVTHKASLLIGTSKSGLIVLRREVISQLFHELADLQQVTSDNGYLPNLELMLLMRPAAIIATTEIAQMRRVGLAVANLAAARGPAEHARLYLDSVCEGERYPAEIARFEHAHDNLRSELRETADADVKPRVMLLTIFDGSDLITGGATSLLTALIEEAGGANAVSIHANVVRLNLEDLLALDPDVLIIGEGVVARGTSPRQIAGDPRFQSLRAVTGRQVYRQPNMWSVPNSLIERPIYVRWLAELLYPKVLGRHAREMVQDAYGFAAGVDLEEDQIDNVLSVNANLSMSEGERFAR